MTKTQPQLALIIPAFNEKDIIIRNAEELKSWMGSNLPDIKYEVVIINDGSTDGMGEMLDEYSKSNEYLRVVHHPTNLGRGQAIRTGFENTNSDFLILLDADLSYSPEHIRGLLEPLLNNQADMVLASPYHKDGEVKNVPLFRALLSKWGNKVLCQSFRTKITTSTCVVRSYKREVVDSLELISTGKDLHLEILYKAELLGFRVSEIPAKLIWRDRNRGKAVKGEGNIISNNPLFKMRKAIISHLLFNFFSKPKFLFIGPILALFSMSVYGSMSIIFAYISNLVKGVESPLRYTLINGELTLTLSLGALLLLFAFTIFLFLASQSKKYFEENYVIMSRTNYRLKQLEKKSRSLS